MLVEGHDGGKGLRAGGAANLLTTVGVHPLVSAEVRELRVGLTTNVAAERFHTTVNVLVLLQSARGREVLPTLRTGVGTLLDATWRALD